MLELIVPDTGGLRRGDCCISISGRFNRILVFREAYAKMRLHQGADFDYVQFLADKDKPGIFWMRPAITGALGR